MFFNINYKAQNIGIRNLNLMVVSLPPTSCPQFYVEGEAPTIVNEKLSAKTTEIYFETFGVMHSGISKIPLWSAELLTKENIDADVPRKNKFHEEKRLPSGESRAERLCKEWI